MRTFLVRQLVLDDAHCVGECKDAHEQQIEHACKNEDKKKEMKKREEEQ